MALVVLAFARAAVVALGVGLWIAPIACGEQGTPSPQLHQDAGSNRDGSSPDGELSGDGSGAEAMGLFDSAEVCNAPGSVADSCLPVGAPCTSACDCCYLQPAGTWCLQGYCVQAHGQ